MLETLARNWRIIAVRGVLTILFGILTLVWPLLTLQTLILLFGAYALVNGLLALITGIVSYGKERWWVALIQGIVSILIGLFVFLRPGATALILLYSIAIWAFLTGIMEIVAAIELRRIIHGEWIMIVSGIASILFSIILYIFPGEGALGLTWLIGIYSIAYGLLLIMLGFRLRNLPDVSMNANASSASRP
jgi:uncharacterized membrane protein HdeD (DUF308 family)